MKKIIIALFTFFPIFAYGENMCVKDGSIMVILDPQISGTVLSVDTTSRTWSLQFGYGVVSGIAGCYNNVGSTTGIVASDQTGITQYTYGQGYCYCKMLRPVESMWVYSGYKLDSTDCRNGGCASRCTAYGANANANGVALRAGLFGNIVQ